MRNTYVLCVLPAAILGLACKPALVKVFENRHPDCRDGQQTVTKHSDHSVARVTGCGHTDEFVSWSGYSWVEPAEALKEASFATGCPLEQTTYRVLPAYTIGVTACGQNLIYKRVSARWILNSETAPPES
jgi:hypothetical protein